MPVKTPILRRLPALAILAAAGAAHAGSAPYALPGRTFLQMEGAPFYGAAALTTEDVANLHGGTSTGSVQDTLLHAAVAMNGDVIGLAPGTRLRISAIAVDGGDPSGRLVGDLQGVSNIAAPSGVRLYDAWFRRDFAALPLQVRVGLIDANEYFEVSPSAGNLINSSFGMGAALTADGGFSIYPKPGYGATLRWGPPGDRWLAGLFQARPADRSGALHHGALAMGEWQHGLGTGGDAKLGIWRCGCGVTGVARGAYAALEWPAGPAQAFLRVERTPSGGGPVPAAVAAGFNLPLGNRPGDSVGAGIAYADLRGRPGETALEATGLWQWTPHLSLQPDLQYVDHPDGGAGGAWVLILRLHYALDRRFS